MKKLKREWVEKNDPQKWLMFPAILQTHSLTVQGTGPVSQPPFQVGVAT